MNRLDLPASVTAEWAAAIDRIATALAADAAQREREGGHAHTQRELLRGSGLLAMSVPVEHGGAGASWAQVFHAVRRLARADSSLAHLFGFQHYQLASVRLFGSPAQQDRYLAATVRERWWWGNAVNARDPRMVVARVDGGWLLDGPKAFCSGALGSDALMVSAAVGPLPTDRKFMVVPTGRPGVHTLDDWDNLGQRQTDSGTVRFDQVRVDDSEVLGPPGAASSPRATLRNLIGQVLLTEIYLGNAFAALDEALAWVRERARPWAMSGARRAADDGLLQLRTGELWAGLQAARALADEVGTAYDRAWDLGDALTAEQRAEVGMQAAAARGVAARTALQVTSQVFELMGASATAARHGHDRHWRNVRAHTLHDPLDYRSQAIGRWLLTGELPDPYGYG